MLNAQISQGAHRLPGGRAVRSSGRDHRHTAGGFCRQAVAKGRARQDVIVVTCTDGFRRHFKHLRNKAGKKDWSARASAELRQKLQEGLQGFALAEHRFGQADPCGTCMIKKNAVVHNFPYAFRFSRK